MLVVHVVLSLDVRTKYVSQTKIHVWTSNMIIKFARFIETLTIVHRFDAWKTTTAQDSGRHANMKNMLSNRSEPVTFWTCPPDINNNNNNNNRFRLPVVLGYVVLRCERYANVPVDRRFRYDSKNSRATIQTNLMLLSAFSRWHLTMFFFFFFLDNQNRCLVLVIISARRIKHKTDICHFGRISCFVISNTHSIRRLVGFVNNTIHKSDFPPVLRRIPIGSYSSGGPRSVRSSTHLHVVYGGTYYIIRCKQRRRVLRPRLKILNTFSVCMRLIRIRWSG